MRERSLHPPRPRMSEELRAGSCTLRKHDLADAMQSGGEDRSSNRRRCRRCSAQGNKCTTSGKQSPCRSWVARHPKPDRAKGGGEGGIAAQLQRMQQNQRLIVRPNESCVPVLCPEVDPF